MQAMSEKNWDKAKELLKKRIWPADEKFVSAGFS
jgi:hypothetical protein